MPKRILPGCAECTIPEDTKACTQPKGAGIKGCPTLGAMGLADKALKEYHKPENIEFTRQASIQESDCYTGRDQKPYIRHPSKPRIQEICEFAQKMNYARLGLIFCAGLAKEAAVVEKMLKGKGFEVVSAICKVGSVPKEAIGLQDSEKVFIGEYEAMCNPIFQAMIVNSAHTDFNIVLGLCVGHDSLFFKYAEAPTTVLAVKDRVTGHNPLAAIYLSDSFFAWL
jgi:uncharacterized metal-binding protein